MTVTVTLTVDQADALLTAAAMCIDMSEKSEMVARVWGMDRDKKMRVRAAKDRLRKQIKRAGAFSDPR